MELAQVEIPQRDKNRFLVFRTDKGGTIRFIDNLVTNWSWSAVDPRGEIGVKLEGANLQYFRGSEILRSVPMMANESKR